MPISLQKGQKVSLTKGNPGLTKVVVGLGWDVNNFDTGGDFDLDAAAFLLGKTARSPPPGTSSSTAISGTAPARWSTWATT